MEESRKSNLGKSKIGGEYRRVSGAQARMKVEKKRASMAFAVCVNCERITKLGLVPRENFNCHEQPHVFGITERWKRECGGGICNFVIILGPICLIWGFELVNRRNS